MQTVYVDVFLFINIIEDSLMLLCVRRILRLKMNLWRFVLAAVAGGLISLAAFVPSYNFIYNILLTISGSAVMILIAFGFKDKRLFLKSVSALIAVSVLISGALIFFYLALKPDGMVIINDRVYFDISPLLLIILTAVVYFILFLYRKLFSNYSKSRETYIVKFLHQNNNYEFTAKSDSGCNVKEPFSGDSVIIMENDSGLEAEKTEFRVIPFESLGGNGIIYGIKPDEIFVDGKKLNREVYIGLCKGIFKNEIKGLIPTDILGG